MKSALDVLAPSRVLLAPMVGLSHYAVREALASFLPKEHKTLWPTEMLNSRRIPNQKKNEVPEIILDDHTRGICPQLLGNEEEPIRRSIEKLKSWGASAIDINMGCPVRKALQHNYGVALMGDSDYAAKVTRLAVEASDLPVSVKLRAGIEGDLSILKKFCEKIQDAGASWITLHPRTAAQKRRGRADWKQIRDLALFLKIPVIGNGDIQTQEDVERMLSETDCARTMVGRAALAKPWLLSDGKFCPKDEFEAGAVYGEFLRRVIELSREVYPEENGLRKIRFLAYHSAVWMEFGHFLYAQLKGAPTYKAALQVLESFFSSPQRQFAKTELRH